MATVTSGRGKAAISYDVTYHGFFFTGNPIGRLHRNMYGVLMDEAEGGIQFARQALAARQQTRGGGGVKGVSFAGVVMGENIVRQPMRMKRAVGRVVISANYGSHPYVRLYNRWIEDASTNRPRGGFRGYHIYRAAAKLVQSHINGRLGQIASKLVEGLT